MAGAAGPDVRTPCGRVRSRGHGTRTGRSYVSPVASEVARRGPAAGRRANTAAFGWGSRHRIPAGRVELSRQLESVEAFAKAPASAGC